MAKHDENKDLRLFSRIGRVNTVSKTLKAPKAQLIGIRMWGRIDYLCNFCGYSFIWDNYAGTGIATDRESTIKRISKEQKREHQLTDKRKSNKRKNNE